jgi:bis(5'-nucleosidyl)-tetraphosphatase
MRIIEAAGFLLFHPGLHPQFLLMQHPKRWDLPKGHAEPKESLLETALRETEEETGIRPDQIVVDPDFQFGLEYSVVGAKRGDYLKRVTYYLGYVDQLHRPKLTEHTGFQWFDWPVAGSLQAATIDPLLGHLKGHFAKFPHRIQTYC